MGLNWVLGAEVEPADGYDSSSFVDYLTVEALMSTPVLTVSPDDGVDTMTELLEEKGVHHLVVTDGQGRLVGILSDRDLLPFHGQTCPVSEVLNGQRILAASPHTVVAEATRAMVEQKISCLPVIDESLLPVGIVTVTDILRHIVHHPDLELWAG